MESIVRRPANVADQEDQWIFTAREVERPASVRAGYCNVEFERYFRIKAVRHVFKLRDHLMLQLNVLYTAAAFIHRFYMLHSFHHYDYHTLACAATFLACKVEEQPKRLRDVVGVSFDLSVKRREPTLHNGVLRYDEQTNDPDLLKLRRQVLDHERALLRTLAFDLNVTQPFYVVAKLVERVFPSHKAFARLVRRSRSGRSKGGSDQAAGGHDDEQVLLATRDVCQVAFMIIQDTMASTACLLFKPHVIAAASLVLACSQLAIPVPNRRKAGPSSTSEQQRVTTEEEGEIASDEDDDDDELLLDESRPKYWLDWIQIHPDELARCTETLMKPYELTQDEFVRTEARATLQGAIDMIKQLSPPVLVPNSDVPEGLREMVMQAP